MDHVWILFDGQDVVAVFETEDAALCWRPTEGADRFYAERWEVKS